MDGSRAATGADGNRLALLAPHWRVVFAAFLGWFLDAFDQVILILALPEIGRHFGVSLTAMGLVITLQSLGRMVGNTSWGWLADRYGRKLTFMLGVIWFAVFSGLSGLAWSYTALLVIQLLFGIGFGGEWTASAALLMETVPPRARQLASSLMMAGYEFGFFAAAGAQALLLPRFGWRALFLVGIAPALLAIFIRIGIAESPVWLAMQRTRRTRTEPRVRFRLDVAALQACVLMLVLQFQNAAIYSFYPTLLKTVHHFTPGGVFAAVAAYSVGSILGKPCCGALASRIGDRATISIYLLVAILDIIPFVTSSRPALLLPSAFVMGAFGNAIFALVPHYLALRFPSDTRSFGMGLAYALASLGQGIAGYVVPWTGRAAGLGHAIELFVVAGSIGVAAIVARQPAALPGITMAGEAA